MEKEDELSIYFTNLLMQICCAKHFKACISSYRLFALLLHALIDEVFIDVQGAEYLHFFCMPLTDEIFI
jgi:hypothetical protein